MKTDTVRRVEPLIPVAENPELRSCDHRPPHSAGLTLVELLVTIAIIGLLVGMLLPALGGARESARRTVCSNNLLQVALATISHDSDRSYLPGWRNAISGFTEAKVAAGRPADAYVSWTVAILPFIGENDMYAWYREFETGAAVDDVTRKRIGVYVCPSADGPTRSALSYMGNGGTGAETLATSEADPHYQQYGGDGAMTDAVGNGYAAARSNLDQIVSGDGVAATLLLVERCGLQSPIDVSWTSTPRPTSTGRHSFETTHAVLLPPALGQGQHPPTDRRIINPTADKLPIQSDDWAMRYPSSRHKGGVVAAFCDGHTKFLSEKIAPWVYCQLMTSAKTSRSPRAVGWEKYPLNGTWVHYIYDAADLAP